MTKVDNHLFLESNLVVCDSQLIVNLNNLLIIALKDMWKQNNEYILKIYGLKINDQFKVILNKKFILRKDIHDIFLNQKKERKIIDNILLYVGTWNVAGKVINDMTNLHDWLLPVKEKGTPDIYIIGLQEIVDLNPKNVVFTSNSHRVINWQKILTKNLSSIDKYEVIKSMDLVGLMLLVFAKQELAPHIKNCYSSINKTGFMKQLGNKGNLIVRFEIMDKSFAFVCCHLCAKMQKNEIRIKEMLEILGKSVQCDNV